MALHTCPLLPCSFAWYKAHLENPFGFLIREEDLAPRIFAFLLAIFIVWQIQEQWAAPKISSRNDETMLWWVSFQLLKFLLLMWISQVNMMSELGEREVLLALRLPAVFCSQRTGGLPCFSSLLLCWHIFRGGEGGQSCTVEVDWQIIAIIAT